MHTVKDCEMSEAIQKALQPARMLSEQCMALAGPKQATECVHRV